MTLLFLGLTVVLMALVVRSTLRRPNKLLKAGIHVLGGIVGLWIVDLCLSILGIAIPINAFTVILVAILGFPGVLMLLALQVLGI